MGTRIGVSSNVDLVTRIPRLPEAGETLAATSFAMGAGGKGANQAVAAARLGADVLLVTRVGDDGLGAGLLKNYCDLGIDTRYARSVTGRSTGTATILVEPSGENRILVAAGANASLGPDDIDEAARSLETCDLILLQLETPLATVTHALAWAAGAGIPVLLNPAPFHPGLDDAAWSRATFVVPNRGELGLITGHPVGTLDAVEAAARALRARGPQAIIVTLGGEGTLIVDGTTTRHRPAISVTTCDTTGAGDAFIGAFAQRWVGTRDIEAAVDQATGYAALSITRHGAQSSYADQAAFRAFLQDTCPVAQNGRVDLV